MQGKILIIDAIATNRIVLKVKLSAAFYRVEQAACLATAKKLLQKEKFDLILTSIELPDGGLAALSKLLCDLHPTLPAPILAVASNVTASDRETALRNGARDVILRPFDDQLLLSQVRALIRVQSAHAELEKQSNTWQAAGLAETRANDPVQPRISIVTDALTRANGVAHRLRMSRHCRLKLHEVADIFDGISTGAPPDAFVLLPPQTGTMPVLQLISALRAHPKARHCAIVVAMDQTEATLAANALDMGADDVVDLSKGPNELSLRLGPILSAKHRADRLHRQVNNSLRASVRDPLTGLYNRRYAMPQIDRLLSNAQRNGKGLAVMVADLDHFKAINDAYGHAAGDTVLIETARRLRGTARPTDLIARLGGEEFLIALPDTNSGNARTLAKRLCSVIGSEGFSTPKGLPQLSVTISIGLAMAGEQKYENSATLIERADKALYTAKTIGRNQVTTDRPAA